MGNFFFLGFWKGRADYKPFILFLLCRHKPFFLEIVKNNCSAMGLYLGYTLTNRGLMLLRDACIIPSKPSHTDDSITDTFLATDLMMGFTGLWYTENLLRPKIFGFRQPTRTMQADLNRYFSLNTA